MKILIVACAIILLSCGNTLCQTQVVNIPSPTSYSVVSRSANSRVWEQTAYYLSPSGQIISNQNSYTELATGLCYQQNGQWQDSQEQINILADGSAAATNGQHQAYFPADIYDGEITLVTADGLQLQSRPVGLSYDDGTNTVLIAQLTNSIGQLIRSNQVIYTNAFAGIDADLLYTYKKGGFEQDVVFREQPPTPEQFGLSSDSTRLQLLTQFFNPPQPVETASPINPQDGLQDTTLSFGSMQMTHGRAFLAGQTSSLPDVHQISVYKSWVTIDGQTLLIEELPYERMAPEFQILPVPSSTVVSSVHSILHKVSSKRLLPPARLVEATTNSVQLAMADPLRKPGVVFDYITMNSGATNFTFQGDSTYFLSGECDFSGTTIFEGGTVVKMTNAPTIEGMISLNGPVVCQTGPYRPAIFTDMNDNSVGATITGSTGSPTFDDNLWCLWLNITNLSIHDVRFLYDFVAIAEGNVTSDEEVTNCQFINGDVAVDGNNVQLYNVLIGELPSVYSQITNSGYPQVFVEGSSLIAENVTADSGYAFIQADNYPETMALTNCLVTREPLVESFNPVIFQTNDLVWLPSPSAPIYLTVGGGNYYLTNGSPYRDYGTANANPALLAGLAQRTTWPPVVYADTNISSLATLSPTAIRDTNSMPDLGYHYDSLDYVVGGCTLYSNLTVNAGTDIGWFFENGTNGIRDSITLDNGANLSFNGNATQPCMYSRHTMVQEGGNTNWSDNTGFAEAAVTFNGSGTPGQPVLSCDFTKWTADFSATLLRDNSAYGAGTFKNSELYDAQSSMYNLQSLYFTNCLFFRDEINFWDQNYAISFAFLNCTFYNGCLFYGRTTGNSGYSSSFWLIENTAFDGTALDWTDNHNANPTNTLFNYNAYNTNNLSWQAYHFPYPPVYGTNELVGPNDVMVTNYNWQTSWFGNFYQPTNSLTIYAGNTNANLLGLYHFTIQTNQNVEGTNRVTIGYHYVGTDTNGNPLDSNGDGIPDYLEDANGDGLVDDGETNWALAILIEPTNETVLQGTNASLNITADGVPPLAYQWYFNSNTIANATNSTLSFSNVQATNQGYYYTIVTNGFGAVTSSMAMLTVVPYFVYAGPNETITNNNTAIQTTSTQLQGIVFGFGGSYTSLWSVVTAPGGSGVTFSNPNLTNTLVTFTNADSTVGTYHLRLTITTSNDTWTGSSDVFITIVPGLAPISYNDFGYRYTNEASDTITNFYITNFDDSEWGIGQGGFGNEESNDDCELVPNTIWPGYDGGYPYLYVRKHFNIPPGTTNLTMAFTVDNDAQIFLNGYLLTPSLTTNVISGTFVEPNIGQIINGNSEWNYVYEDVSEGHTNWLTNYFDHSDCCLPDDLILNGISTNIWHTNDNVLAVRAYDDGEVSYYDGRLSLQWVSTNPPLMVQFVTPTNDQSFIISPTNILLTALATNSLGNTNISVVFTNQTQSTGLGEGILQTNGTYLLAWSDVTNGTYLLTATAHDGVGDVATSEVSITVNAMPVVNIISPANLQPFREVTNITLQATASDSDATITNLQFYMYPTNLLGTAINVTSNLYQWLWPGLTNGWYPVVAVATDNRGSTAISPPVVFQVTATNPPPFVEIISPTNDGVFVDGASITITATAHAMPTNSAATVTNVEFFVNGESIGSATNAPYSITQCCWEPGTYQLFALATDTYGSSSVSSNIQITVAPEPATGYWDPTLFTTVPPFVDDLDGYYPTAVAVGSNGVIYVAGGFDDYASVYASADDGQTWQPMSVITADPITGFLVDGPDLYIFGGNPEVTQNGTNLEANILMWNGSYWSVVGNTNNDPYNIITVSSSGPPYLQTLTKVDGVLYVGTSGDTNGVYEFNTVSNEWLPVGNGLSSFDGDGSQVSAIAGLNDALYIGGSFANAGGDSNANFIASLKNNTWTNVGLGIAPLAGYDDEGNPYADVTCVNSLSTCGTNLFVGGAFSAAGDVTNAYGIALWNGDDWLSLNGGVAPSGVSLNGVYITGYIPIVDSILVHGERIYISGPFTNVFSGQTTIPANGIAMATWNDASQSWAWSDLDGGIDSGSISSDAILPGDSATNYDLYIFGKFNSVGSSQITANNIARWRVGYPYPTGLPIITITNPPTGTMCILPTNIVVTATIVSSTDVGNVQLYANGQSPPLNGSANGDGSYNFSFSPSFAGVYQLIVTATNASGCAASKPILIDVKGATNPVTARDVYYSIPQNSPPVNFYVLTNDLPTNGLAVGQITELPTGSTNWANFGTPAVGYAGQYITYTPTPGAYGSDFFYYTVTNAAGSNDTASITVNIYPVPQVTITNPVYSVESVATTDGVISLSIGGNSFESGGSISNISLFVNGALYAHTNTPNFNFNWSTISNGVNTFVAVATDANGITNASSPVTVVATVVSTTGTGSTSTNQLVATNTSLVVTYDALGNPITPAITNGIFDLHGQASASPSGPSFPVDYQVILCTSDGNDTPLANLTPQPDANGFHEGGDNAGDLGMLNFSSVANGVYDLQLNVYGGGTQTNVTVRFILNTTLKVGQFSFSEQDLNLPVNGIPVTITRTYNSQNLNSADFGYGWTLAMNSLNVQLDEQRQDVVIGSDQAPFSENESDDGVPQTESIRTGGGWDVSLTLPNGQQTTFAFSLNLGTEWATAEWNAPPWVHATLTPIEANSDIIYYPFASPEPYWYGSDLTFGNAPINYQDFPGWILTTKPDGTKYYLTRQFVDDVVYVPDSSQPDATARVLGPPTLTQIVQPSGNSIVIKPNSIYHVDPSGTNISAVVNITRDGRGRITAISDPDTTNGLPLVQYVYDPDSGNLIRVLKLQDRNAGTYATTTYDYNNPNFPHYITSIENANGAPITRNYYDSTGRLTQTVNALGNTNQFIYAATNMELTVDPLGRTNTLVYDSSGNIIVQTNALSEVSTMAYDGFNDKTNEVTYLRNGQPYATNNYSYDTGGLGLLLSSTDPLGDTNGYTYNGFGEALTSADALGHTIYNTYDSNGELINTVDALLDTNANVYQDALLAGSTDPIGTTTTNYYDAYGNLTNTATLDALGTILSSNTYTYDANNNRITSTVWRHVGSYWTNATTAYVYDAQNRVVQTINPDGGTNTTVYNLIGQQAETIDALGNTNLYFYDAAGHLIETQYPDGSSETSAYDAAGNRTNSTDRLQHPTAYFYDALNRLTNTIYPDNATSATIYDDLGRVAQTIDARGTVTANAYDADGRRIAVTNAFGISGISSTNFYTYDADGNQIIFTDANGHATTNVYDVLNRQVQVLYPDGTATETAYDKDGRSVAQINQDNITNEFGYDGAGRLIAVTNALQQITRYQYDEAGNEITQIDALGRTNLYFYDGQGRRILHTMPGGQSEGFAYDLDGNQVYATNFNNVVITNTYDENNRLMHISSGISYQVSFLYSATGQRTNMMDASGVYTYIYDSRDRLLQKNINWNGCTNLSLNYLYDPNGNVTNIWSSTSNGVNLIYAYDPLNRLTNVLANGSATAAYAYDLAGNLQALRYGNGVTNQYQYDALNRLTSLTWKLNLSTLANFSYQLGLTGNRTNLNETVGGTNRLYTWQYDNLYRLTNENESSSVSPYGNLAYQYDSVGNRTNRNSGLGLPAQSFIYNPNDWLTNTDKYDSNGNTTNNSANILYQYDVMNHLTNAGSIVMMYDGDGIRVSKTVGGTSTYYLVDDQNPSGYAQVLEEWTVMPGSSTNLSKVYNYGLSLISQRQPNVSTNYFISDDHASTRMLTDIGGSVVNVFVYDAYGNLIASNGVPQTAYLYCGQQYDSDLGLYYNRARYQNQNTGRFWTSDTTEGDQEDPLSLHKYLYAADDPVNLDDPSGNDYGDFDINISSILQPLANVLLASAGTPGGMSLQQLGAFAPKFPVVVVTMPNGTQYLPETKVKDSDQQNIVGAAIGTPIYIAVPQGVVPQELVDTWTYNKKGKRETGQSIDAFLDFWRPGGPHDYKSLNPPSSEIYDAFGNFEFGASAYPAGFTLEQILWWGDRAHPSGQHWFGENNPINSADITSGYNATKNGGKLSTEQRSILP